MDFSAGVSASYIDAGPGLGVETGRGADAFYAVVGVDDGNSVNDIR